MNKNQTKILELKHRKIEMEKTKQNPEWNEAQWHVPVSRRISEKIMDKNILNLVKILTNKSQ